MKLDAIFQSLQVENQQDIIQLLQYVIVSIELEEEEEGDMRNGATQRFEIMQPDMVSQALRSYIEARKEREAGIPVKVASRVDKERERKEILDGDYWNKMANILPPMHECLWNALLDGLGLYNNELDRREKLIEETDSLQLQNTELKMLLQQYLDAQVNQELLQPPVQMLALN
ncbi:Dynein regulatory complex protein 1-like [Oopsacas minuta]|uniref:Dynein regulatory complex protein 1-like n=1 Tax=Oopsacas minuta TaxID=111878 RepID=A0AAV7KA86_9METZ|nr:Dynein regulatory complex protein 1-like [Oopsacas minuta]